jgi:hypothetical protein
VFFEGLGGCPRVLIEEGGHLCFALCIGGALLVNWGGFISCTRLLFAWGDLNTGAYIRDEYLP